MIRCNPKGLCSWDYRLAGDGHRASVEFNWTSEQGLIIADDSEFQVRKHGIMSGHWTLERGHDVIASARKSSAFTRRIEIESPMGALVLCAASAFTRSFRIERSDELIATIAPVHLFTRRSTIDARTTDYDFRTIAFAFWLAALMWRRSSSNNS